MILSTEKWNDKKIKSIHKETENCQGLKRRNKKEACVQNIGNL